MPFNYDGTGVHPSGGKRKAIPAGPYRLRIVDTEDGKSKIKDDGTGGYPQIKVTWMVAEGDYSGCKIPFHYVTFFPKDHKGAGMAIHFLKCIGQPWEGKFKVDHMAWRGAEVVGDVVEEEYNGYINNKVTNIDPVNPPQGEPPASGEPEDMEKVPF